MQIKNLILAVVLALILAVAGVALANGDAELPRWVLGAGASDSAGGDVTLRATLGQPVAGVVSGSSGNITLGQGIWHGGSLSGDGFDVYLPLVRR